MAGLLEELRRRNVVRVGIAYIVVAWLILQFADVVLDNITAPDWVMQAIMLLLAIGLPVAIVFAWAFEITPEGLKTTKEVDRSDSVTHNTGRKLDRIIIAVLVVAVGYFLWERQQTEDLSAPPAETITETTDAGSGAEAVAEEASVDDAEPIRRSIAVLPFVNMSSDEEQEWFADGLTEEILNSLARTPDLLVTARTSSFAYKDSTEDLPTIANALGVAHVLEGSVRRSGDRLRVTAQLIRANDGFHLWSQTYDRDVADLIDIQENVAIEIARALKTAIDPEALARFVSSGTDSIPAFEAYLRGLSAGASQLVTGDVYGYLEAPEAYTEAIRLDPEFALAYWELAAFWQVQLTETFIPSGITDLSPSDLRNMHDAALEKAIIFEKDPVRKDLYKAQEAYANLNLRRALQLVTDYLAKRPNDYLTRTFQMQLLNELGRQDEVYEIINSVYERQGHDAEFTSLSQFSVVFSGDNEQLETHTQNALRRYPDNANIIYQAHRAFLWIGDIDAASKLLPLVNDGEMPESVRILATLRQACAENRIADAKKLFDRGNEKFADETSTIWIMQKIMGYDELADDYLMTYDEQNQLSTLASFLTYGNFEPRQYPNLMAELGDQMEDRGAAMVLPYRCEID